MKNKSGGSCRKQLFVLFGDLSYTTGLKSVREHSEVSLPVSKKDAFFCMTTLLSACQESHLLIVMTLLLGELLSLDS